MEEGKVGIWTGFVNSFNPEAYGKIVKQKFSRSFLYLLVIVLVISALFSVKFTSVFTRVAAEFIDKAGQEIPEIRITEGVVSVPVEQPYIYEAAEYAFIIDTTGEITSLDNYDSGLLLLRDKIIYRDKARMKTESYDLSKIAALHITPETLQRGLKKGSKILVPALFVALTVWFIISKFIQVFLFSLVSLFANNLKKKNLTYPELLNIGIYALTAPTVLAAFLVLFNVQFRLFGLIYALLYILILVLAIGKLSPETGAPGAQA
ncbi:MAG: DUF1189 domain-containing protein [Candidatus Ratteibacteria bacterium]|nr:DUF1189 domain-containing protein [Candidatus Ratteibacteria bacterium]